MGIRAAQKSCDGLLNRPASTDIWDWPRTIADLTRPALVRCIPCGSGTTASRIFLFAVLNGWLAVLDCGLDVCVLETLLVLDIVLAFPSHTREPGSGSVFLPCFFLFSADSALLLPGSCFSLLSCTAYTTNMKLTKMGWKRNRFIPKPSHGAFHQTEPDKCFNISLL